jgi:cellulose synthase/poly-beta-1,6-N-acetylglucosamine synthase-like glycosyltransferase
MPSLDLAWKLGFWAAAACVFHVYLGYPLIIAILSRVSRRVASPVIVTHLPPVSLIISAYNEHRVIAEKLENALALDYPQHLLEIMVISDGSEDGTDEIVQQHSRFGVRLVRQEQRLGKTLGLNLGVPQTTGQILVFSDSNVLYRPDAICRLTRNFADPKVGYVVGNARYVDNQRDSQSAESEGLYWRMETWLKHCESQFHSVVGGDGAIYAIRRELYQPLRSTDINDFLNPLQIIDRGYVGVFEPAAVSYEEAGSTFAQEFRRKVRIVSRSLNAVFRVPGSLNPLKNPRHWFMLISHKILRWLAPFFLVLLFVASVGLSQNASYRYLCWLQAVLYLMALLGWITNKYRLGWKILNLPYYFCVVNLASMVGVLKFLRGDISGIWTTIREDIPAA